MNNDDRVLPKPKQKNKVKGSNSPQGDALSSAPLPLTDMYRGYLPLWRKITDWGWYKEGNTARVFIHLLLKANREQKDYLGYTIYPGQCVTGRKSLSVELGLSEQQIRTAFNHLKSTNEITTKTTNKFSIITLINWEKYLPKNYLKGKNLTINQPTSNQQVTTTNKDNKDKKDNNTLIGKKFIIPSLKDISEYCSSRDNNVNPEQFRDFYQSKDWYVGKNKMKDWKAAVRTWERNSPKPKGDMRAI